MKKFWAGAVVAACVTASLAGGGASPAVAFAGPGHSHDSLGTVINDAIHEGGPLFTASERALIVAKCGYRAGDWDGRSMNMSNGVFTCTNGKKVDDPQMRAMLAVAQPRISARINDVMAKPAVQDAIRQLADDAVRQALAKLATRDRD